MVNIQGSHSDIADRLPPFATFALSLDISYLNIHNLCIKEKEMN